MEELPVWCIPWDCLFDCQKCQKRYELEKESISPKERQKVKEILES